MRPAPPISVVVELEEPILGELFSADRMEQHAESLAAAQAISDDAGAGKPLIPRVAENGRLLLEYYRSTARASQREQSITPAAQWLVDNFYIVEEQLREIRDHLPTGFYRKIAQTCLRPSGRLSASLWRCLGIRCAHGQPFRSGDAAPVCHRLPARATAFDR